MEEKIDARTLSRAVLEEKRGQAHRLRKRGLTRAEIGNMVGVHADTVGRWLKLDKHHLKLKRNGRKLGDARLLSPKEEKRIRAKIIDKTPDQLKLQYALWTRKAVQELIERETRVRLAIRSVGGISKTLGHDAAKATETRLPTKHTSGTALVERRLPPDPNASQARKCRDLLGR